MSEQSKKDSVFKQCHEAEHHTDERIPFCNEKSYSNFLILFSTVMLNLPSGLGKLVTILSLQRFILLHFY